MFIAVSVCTCLYERLSLYYYFLKKDKSILDLFFYYCHTIFFLGNVMFHTVTLEDTAWVS